MPILRRRKYTSLILSYERILRKGINDIVSYINDIHSILNINKNNIEIGKKLIINTNNIILHGTVDFILNGEELFDIKVNNKDNLTKWKRQLELYSDGLSNIKSYSIINLYTNHLVSYEK